MTALTGFYDYVLPDLQRCPENLALLHIRLACEEFYARSKLKRADLTQFNTSADTSTYALTLPTGFVVAKMLHVELDSDTELTAIGPDDRDSLDADWRNQTAEPEYYFMPDSTQLTLFLTPDDTYAIDCYAALKPKSDATTIDDWVFEQYREQIAAGSKARLMKMKNKPWSGDYIADQNMFETAIYDAKHAAERGRGRAPKRTRPVFGVK